MFKKVLVVVAATCVTFVNIAIYAGEVIKVNADQIMLPITTGRYTFYPKDFSNVGTTSLRVDVSSCPASYLYPYVMAYPSEVVTGDGVSCSYTDFPVPNVRLIKSLAITPICDNAGCNLAIAFGSLFYDEKTKYIVPAVSACSSKGSDGHLTITYVVYCSTKPMQSGADKYELDQTK